MHFFIIKSLGENRRFFIYQKNLKKFVIKGLTKANLNSTMVSRISTWLDRVLTVEKPKC